MKHITKIVAAAVGAMASIFAAACDRQASRVYGAQNAEVIRSEASPLMTQDFPETDDDAVGDIYGPPSMLLGRPYDDPIEEYTDEPLGDDIKDEHLEEAKEADRSGENIKDELADKNDKPTDKSDKLTDKSDKAQKAKVSELVRPSFRKNELPMDKGIVAAPVYGIRVREDVSAASGSKTGEDDKEDADEVIKAYRDSFKKRPPIAKYGIRPKFY